MDKHQVEIGAEGLVLTVDGKPIIVIDRLPSPGGVELHMTVHAKADRGACMPHRRVCVGVRRHEGFECSAPTRMDVDPVTYEGVNMDADKARALYKADYKSAHGLDLSDNEIRVKELTINYGEEGG
jgi:hypothetical protein